MSHRKGKPAPARPRETTDSPEGKLLLRQAWEYGQRIDRTTRTVKHPTELFSSELEGLRRKVRDKCSQLLLLSSPNSQKAVELLWKKSVYEVVSLCKQQKQALDGSSELFLAYSHHLSSSLSYYAKLLQKLEKKHGITLTTGDNSGLEELGLSDGATAGVLKEVCYHCLLHMGDIARYQVDVGGSPFAAVAYYHHAIGLDSTQGTPFNQLAAMVGSKNEHLDSVYYYQRSITSAHPFEGSKNNLQKIYSANKEALSSLTVEMRRATEPTIKELTCKLLIAQFIHLQYMLSPNKGSAVSSDVNLGTLCEEVVTHLEECWQFDFEQFREECSSGSVQLTATSDSSSAAENPNMASNSRRPALLPPDLLLKVAALSILPSHSLRLLGSTLTPAATAFALSVFSQLLEYSHRRLACILLTFLESTAQTKSFSSSPVKTKWSKMSLNDILDSGESMLDAVVRETGGGSLAPFEKSNIVAAKRAASANTKSKSLMPQPVKKLPTSSKATNSGMKSALGGKKEKQKRLKKAMISDRRRRRPAKHELSSEEEDQTSGSEDDRISISQSSSEDSLVLLQSESIGEDDLEMLESLSDSSSLDDDDGNIATASNTSPQKSSSSSQLSIPTPPIPKKDDTVKSFSPSLQPSAKSRRKIVLAANFDFPPKSPANEAIGITEKTQSSTSQKPIPPSRGNAVFPSASDDLLLNLMEDTRQAEVVHTVCSLVAKDSFLICLKMFVDWLQSYPVVIATCAQSSATIWSRLAALLNFLPNSEELASAGFDVAKYHSTALLEDIALRGFAPLAPSQEGLHFGTTPPNQLEQAIARICYLHKFGQYVANARTAPSFTWDSSCGKYIGPAQKLQQEARIARESELQESKKAERSRSKLMQVMAQQRLQSEVADLTEASKGQAALFTPYLLPDAHTLCSTLHLVKKLIKTEKFVFVISKSVIESLDGMKKGRENYAAREAIKFLEKEFKSGSKFFRAQQPSETLQSAARKPPRMEIPTWHFKCLVDCAAYINQSSVQDRSKAAIVTLLLERRVCSLLNDLEEQARHPQMTEVAQYAQQCGLEIETLLDFYKSWQAQSK